MYFRTRTTSQTFRDILPRPAGVKPPAQLSVLQLTEAILELVEGQQWA